MKAVKQKTCRIYDRWICIGHNNPLRVVLKYARALGIELIDVFKPGMVAWYAIRFKADTTQIRRLDSAMLSNMDLEYFRRQPQGAWPPKYCEPISWEQAEKNLGFSI